MSPRLASIGRSGSSSCKSANTAAHHSTSSSDAETGARCFRSQRAVVAATPARPRPSPKIAGSWSKNGMVVATITHGNSPSDQRTWLVQWNVVATSAAAPRVSGSSSAGATVRSNTAPPSETRRAHHGCVNNHVSDGV
eukprot:3712707-Prymnesium_polylepis.1